MKPQLSLIITTYNRPDALKIVLNSVTNQQMLPTEVLIADDGSDDSTAVLLQKLQLPFPTKHIWQEDQGFRAASARNRAVAAATGDYLVFIDGDCLLRPNFIQQHHQLAAQNWFVAGHRLLLSASYTQQLLAFPITPPISLLQAIQARMRGNLNRLLPLLTLPDSQWRLHRPQRWQAARTCNLGMWRDDFVRVNGFDERFNGWGYEDSDLAVRLIRAGVGCKDGRYATGVYHLWHQENDRSRERDNHQLLQATLNGDYTRAVIGLDQYTNA